MAPWLINRLTTKWTMILAFCFFTVYIAANFYPRHFLMIPLSVLLGSMAGPMWSAQATYVTTLALTYAQHRKIIFESDDVINQFMGVFFGFHRSSQIWGNLISTLILSLNGTELSGNSTHNSLSFWRGSRYRHFMNSSEEVSLTSLSSSFWEDEVGQCGAKVCNYIDSVSQSSDEMYSSDVNELVASIPDATRYMLLTSYLACGVMAGVVVVALLDQIHLGKTEADPEFSQSSWELCLATVKMLKDTKCLLLMPLVTFVGLEQGFMFGDFTKVWQCFVVWVVEWYVCGDRVVCVWRSSGMCVEVWRCVCGCWVSGL